MAVAAASGSALAAHAGRQDLSTSQIAAKVSPALVDVTTTLGYAHAAAAGTGLVVTSSGEVLTNNHVVEAATGIKVTDIGNGRTYPAVVAGYDRTHDIAVLRLRGASGLRTVTFGDSSKVAVGQRVVALGNAGGKGGKPSVAAGHVVGLHQAITALDAAASTSERLSGLIHTNAPVRPGDSGGPLVNGAGQVIGINTAASAGPQFRLRMPTAHTQAFAIPASQARAIAAKIEAGHSTATVHVGPTAFLGVQVLPAGAAGGGVQPGGGAAVARTLPGLPAARAGLRAGDMIVSVGGRRVTSPTALQSAMSLYHPGDRVTIAWNDPSGVRHSATVILASGPAG